MLSLEQLETAIWDAVNARKDSVTGEAVPDTEWHPSDGTPDAAHYADDFPALRYLDEAVALATEAGFGEIAESFRALVRDPAQKMAWSQNANYTADRAGEALKNGYCYAALSGPDGPLFRAAPRGGLALFAPGVNYPAHNHAPKEVYLVLTPGAQWQLDRGEWFDVKAGDLIYHRPWQVHSMRTTDQPMLAFAGWMELGDRGQIGFVPDAD